MSEEIRHIGPREYAARQDRRRVVLEVSFLLLAALVTVALLIAASGYGYQPPTSAIGGWVVGAGPVFSSMRRESGILIESWRYWSRDVLDTELLLDNFHLNGSGVDRWHNTGALGAAGDYIQTTAMNQPIVGSSTHGAWFTANSKMTKASSGNEGTGDDVTRYFVVKLNYSGSWKIIAN